MPSTRINVPLTAAPGTSGGADLTPVAGNALNHKVLNQIGSRVIIFARNDSGGPITVTLKKVTQIVHADDIAVSVGAGEVWMSGPLPSWLYTQPSGDETGYVQVDLSATTNMTLWAICF